MLLKIEENRTIHQINEDFNAKFPHLKIVFFKKDEKNLADSKSRVTILDVPLSKLYPNMRNAHININGNLQARSLELKVEELTGIPIQIFRRSGNVWLETLTTDNKTLAELSRMAQESLLDVDEDLTFDYHEQP